MEARHTRLLLAALNAALLLCAACAGHSGETPSGAPLAEELARLDPGPGFVFPELRRLPPHSGAFTLLDLVRDGAQYEASLPNNGVSMNGSFLDFNATGVDMATAAYAIYAFPLAGYDRDANLLYSWATPPPGFSDVFIGLSNWQENRWEWRNADAGGVLALGSMAPYIGPDSQGLCYVVVILAGSLGASLDSLQVGSNLPADTLYVVPAQTVADPGQPVRLSLMCTGSLHPFHSLESVRIIVPQYNNYVPGSLNAGAPGGAPSAPDGIWASMGGPLLTLPDDGSILAVDLGGGLIAFDLFVHASGGGELSATTGELLNFELAVYTDVAISLQRNDGAQDRTFYTDATGSPHFWTYDDNAGGQGITLSGNAPPQADLQADSNFSASLPFTVSFDASQSQDTLPGSIVQYEFDFGDGGGFSANGANPLASHDYTVKGKYSATVRVTDNEGAQATESLDIWAAYYDEVEPNQPRAQGNALPPLPFADFHGSIGTSPDYPAYDGGISDYFNFVAAPGDKLLITCSFETVMDLQLHLMNSTGTPLAQSAADSKSPQTIVWTVGAGESPLNLLVVAPSGGGDYTLAIQLNPPVADLQATPSSGDPPLLVDFDASGSYDPPPGMIVKYEFDFGDGAGWQDFGATNTAQYTYSTDGSYQAKLRVTDDIGLTDTTQITIRVGDPYSEQEDNDDHAQANAVTFPMINWTGSLGANPPFYEGYDGDDRDYIRFNATAGQTITFNLSGDSDTADIDIHLEDVDSNILAESITPEAEEMFEYTFTADGEYWVYIELWYQTEQEGYSDYFCNATLL